MVWNDLPVDFRRSESFERFEQQYEPSQTDHVTASARMIRVCYTSTQGASTKTFNNNNNG